MTLVPGVRLGPYEIVAPLGAGGMGEVYSARDERLGRDVAVKVLPVAFSADAERLRRFEQEARAAGALNHPGITAVFDVGTHAGNLRGEVVVYDTASHRAHCLNATAAFVFRHADGRRTAAEIAALLGPGADEDLVGSALDQLGAAELLEPDGECAQPAASRREVLRQVGPGAAVLAPMVISLVVPTPAEAAATCVPVAVCPSNQGKFCYNSNPATECLINTCQGSLCQP